LTRRKKRGKGFQCKKPKEGELRSHNLGKSPILGKGKVGGNDRYWEWVPPEKAGMGRLRIFFKKASSGS